MTPNSSALRHGHDSTRSAARRRCESTAARRKPEAKDVADDAQSDRLGKHGGRLGALIGMLRKT